MSEINTVILSPEQEKKVVMAIQKAELNTSGEIRIHIETSCTSDVYNRCMDMFSKLEMYKTQQRNGVLIYVAFQSKSFAIYGDKGINQVVKNNFWESTKNTIQTHFERGDYQKGLIDGVAEIGKQLKQFFPISDDDKNELSDTISRTE